MSIYGLGTVGATAGFFVLDLCNSLSSVPQLWGVATLNTNFSALTPYGINLYGTGTLQINTTQQIHVQTLTLQGLGPGSSDETQTFTLPAAQLRRPDRRRGLDHPARAPRPRWWR